MSAFLYLAGFIIGAAIFLYLYSAYQSSKEKIRSFRAPASPPAPTVNPDRIDYFRMPRPPGARICPLCGKELTHFEALYASEVEEDGKKKILIHGCRYCYKNESQ